MTFLFVPYQRREIQMRDYTPACKIYGYIRLRNESLIDDDDDDGDGIIAFLASQSGHVDR